MNLGRWRVKKVVQMYEKQMVILSEQIITKKVQY